MQLTSASLVLILDFANAMLCGYVQRSAIMVLSVEDEEGTKFVALAASSDTSVYIQHKYYITVCKFPTVPKWYCCTYVQNSTQENARSQLQENAGATFLA